MKKTKLAVALFMLMFTALNAQNITVFRPGTNPRSKKDIMVKAAEKYKAKTGGKVQFVMGDWGTLESKILTYMAAGNPIDVCFARSMDFPKFYTKNYLEPLEDYIDMDSKYLSLDAMNSCFKYNGHYYNASAKTSDHYWIVIYNKSLMDEEGIPESEQPYALWKAGKWDWDHLRDLAIKLTKDTTGSGTIDRWGFANWYTQGFIYSNGVTLTNIDKDANITLNFEDQKVTEALAFLQNAKNDGWYLQDNNIAQDGIQNRTVAMLMGREYDPSTILNNTRDELVYVPVPFGPSNKNRKNIYECDGYGIGAGSKNQKWAGIYIDCVIEATYEEDVASRAKTWPEEIFELGAELEKNRWYPGYTESPISTIINSFLGEIVWSGNSPATAVASWTPKAVALVQDANKPMGKLEKLPFRPISEEFKKEKDALQIFSKMPDTEYTSVNLSYEKKGIDKGSLKISCDYEVDGEDMIYCISDPAKLGVVGWRAYNVEFDIKPVKQPGEGAYVYYQFWDSEINNYGWASKEVAGVDEVVHISAFCQTILQNGKIPMIIGGHNMKDFIIDNIVITEYE